MFVATAGGQSYKLGDVEVQLFSLGIIGQHIKAADERFAPLSASTEQESERVRPLLEQIRGL